MQISLVHVNYFYVYVSCDAYLSLIADSSAPDVRKIPQSLKGGGGRGSVPDAGKGVKGGFFIRYPQEHVKVSKRAESPWRSLDSSCLQCKSLHTWTRVRTNSLRGSASCY